jgi:hypothetical protein
MTTILASGALLFALTFSSAFAPDEEASLGGFICARPPTPACASALNAKASSAELAACRGELESFAAATAAYRDCLGGQMGDAMRHANEVLSHFRCVLAPKACSKTGGDP